MNDWINVVADLTKSNTDHFIVTLVDIVGSAPQVVSSKMIVTDAGLYSGTIGGGKIEKYSIEFAQKCLEKKEASSLQSWNLQKDIGMSCGGEVKLFFDGNYFSNWNVALFGAGHVSQELTRVMSTWSCRLSVFDTRKEWIEKLPEGKCIHPVLSSDLSAEVANLPRGSFVVCMTQGHATDVPILLKALKEPEKFSFIGVIGSKVKGIKIKKELKELGISEDVLEALKCPVGLDFGNNTPPEIAISIASQILLVRDSIKEAK